MREEILKHLNKIEDLKSFILIFTEEKLKYYSTLKNWGKYKKRIGMQNKLKNILNK